MTDERLEAIFKSFDTDGNGCISAQNIIDSFSKSGKEISYKDLEQIMKLHDKNNDGVIDLEEFKEIFNKKPS